MNPDAVCTRATIECTECGRPKCDRCGRCKHRRPTNLPGDWTLYCPSAVCRIIKSIKRLL